MGYQLSADQAQAIADEYRPHVVESYEGQMDDCVQAVLDGLNRIDPNGIDDYPPLLVTAVRLDIERFTFDGGPDWWKEQQANGDEESSHEG